MIDHEFGVFATFQTPKKATYITLDLYIALSLLVKFLSP